MQTNIYDTINQLERELRQHPSYVALKEVNEEIINNEDALELFERVRQKAEEFGQRQQTGQLDQEFIQSMQDLYEEAGEDPLIGKYMQYEREYNQLMDDVYKATSKPLHDLYNRRQDHTQAN